MDVNFDAIVIPAAAHLKQNTIMCCVYYIPLVNIPAEELENIKRELDIQPYANNYQKKVNQNTVRLMWTEGPYLVVPRGYGLRLIGEPAKDLTSKGNQWPIDAISFVGSLRPELRQDKACETILALQPHQQNGYLSLPCGYGKTVVMTYLAAQWQRQTLVCVSTVPQRDQAYKTIQTHLPGARVKLVQQKKQDIEDADIVIVMVQTLLQPSCSLTRQRLRVFGVAFIDEAHHMAAKWLSQLLLKLLPCQRIIGLSATVRRNDGMGLALNYLIGPVLYKVTRPPGHARVEQIVIEQRCKFLGSEERPNRAGMVSLLAMDVKRTSLGVRAMHTAYLSNRSVLAITGRSEQMTLIRQLLQALFKDLVWLSFNDFVFMGFAADIELPVLPFAPQSLCPWLGMAQVKIGYLRGGMKSWQVDLLDDMNFVIAIDILGKEGLNVPHLNTMVFFNGYSDIEQLTGRILRKDTGQVPLYVDIVDDFSIFKNMGWKRRNYFLEQNFHVVRKKAELSPYLTPIETTYPPTLAITMEVSNSKLKRQKESCETTNFKKTSSKTQISLENEISSEESPIEKKFIARQNKKQKKLTFFVD